MITYPAFQSSESQFPCFSVVARTQPIIANATANMLKEHILPVAEKLREQSVEMEKEEEEFIIEMRRMQHQRKDSGEVEMEIQEVTVLYKLIFTVRIFQFINSLSKLK